MTVKQELYNIITEELKLYRDYPTAENIKSAECIEACRFWAKFVEYYLEYNLIHNDTSVIEFLKIFLNNNKSRISYYKNNKYIKSIIPLKYRKELELYEY